MIKMKECYLNNTEFSCKTENVIYALLEPKTNEIRYIGKAKNLELRLRKHAQSSKLKENTHKNNWIKSLLKSGEKFIVVVIDSALTNDELNKKEVKWISYYKTIGCRLTNATNGGDGGKLSQESISKMKETKKKNPQKPYWIGKKFEKEHCENLSKSKKGYVTNDETKEKLSKSHKGLNTWSKDRKLSEETKIKMSKSRIGKVKNYNAVYQLGLNNEIIKRWDAPYFAEKELKLSRSKIDSVCKGKRKTTGGFAWVYVENYDEIKCKTEKEMEKITKLAVFDFDGTLVSSPLPETGRKEYEEKTGEKWPHKGWWSRGASLDHTIFDIPIIPNVIEDYKRVRQEADTTVIMLTGRLEILKNDVMAILEKHELIFDHHFFNTGGSTDIVKMATLDKFLEEHPDIVHVELWDDRLEHIPQFTEWGTKKVESGRLQHFDIHVVPTGRH